MLDFCAEKGVASEIEIIPRRDIEKAYERMLKSDVKYRFVIDMQSLKGRGGEGGLGRHPFIAASISDCTFKSVKDEKDIHLTHYNPTQLNRLN